METFKMGNINMQYQSELLTYLPENENICRKAIESRFLLALDHFFQYADRTVSWDGDFKGILRSIVKDPTVEFEICHGASSSMKRAEGRNYVMKQLFPTLALGFAVYLHCPLPSSMAASPPPWNSWSLDEQFFGSLCRWTLDNPGNSLTNAHRFTTKTWDNLEPMRYGSSVLCCPS
jgi:hypothetical protein